MLVLKISATEFQVKSIQGLKNDLLREIDNRASWAKQMVRLNNRTVKEINKI